ncbi:MAG: hypothetical protein QM689_04425 [Oscillospiraceae bacterium]
MAEETTVPTGAPAAAPDTSPAKTFTQEDVNALVSKGSKSAVEKLLKDAGIAPEGDYKTAMKAFREWQDSQKTELEKATGSLSAAEKAKQDAETKAAQLERQLAAVKKGVPADKTDKYIKLAEAYTDDKTDFDAALDAALKDFPVTAKPEKPPYVPPNPAAPANPEKKPTGAAIIDRVSGKMAQLFNS